MCPNFLHESFDFLIFIVEPNVQSLGQVHSDLTNCWKQLKKDQKLTEVSTKYIAKETCYEVFSISVEWLLGLTARGSL